MKTCPRSHMVSCAVVPVVIVVVGSDGDEEILLQYAPMAMRMGHAMPMMDRPIPITRRNIVSAKSRATNKPIPMHSRASAMPARTNHTGL